MGLADTVSHRARLLWLSAAMIASAIAFAVTRPTPPPRSRPLALVGHCRQGHGPVAVTVTVTGATR